MTILLRHVQNEYVNKDCRRGFCDKQETATEFMSIFKAMKYLIGQGVVTITDYKFIDNTQKDRKHANTKIDINRRRRRTV